MFKSKEKSRILKPVLVVIAGVIALALLASCDAFSTKSTEDEIASPPEETEVVDSSIEIPGDKDFMSDGKLPENGAVLGSPAFDMFLDIDGVPGESTDAAHKEWIDILSFSWGETNPAGSATGSTGDRTTERCNCRDFSIVKTLDKASPKLALYCCNGKHLPEVTLEICRADGDKVKYMEYTLTDVIVSSVNVAGTAGTEELPVEEVTFTYARIHWTYTEYDHATGKPKGNIEAYWDIVMNSGE